MPQEYKEGWIALGLIILFGFVLTSGFLNDAEAEDKRIRVETQCDATTLYVIDGQGRIRHIYDCEGNDG